MVNSNKSSRDVTEENQKLQELVADKQETLRRLETFRRSQEAPINDAETGPISLRQAQHHDRSVSLERLLAEARERNGQLERDLLDVS